VGYLGFCEGEGGGERAAIARGSMHRRGCGEFEGGFKIVEFEFRVRVRVSSNFCTFDKYQNRRVA